MVERQRVEPRSELHGRPWKWVYFRKRFHEPLRKRIKRFTLRNQRLGKPGDPLATPVGLFRLVAITRQSPLWVAENLWELEGCTSPEDFLSEWDNIHPGEDLDELRFLHELDLEVLA